MPASNQRAVDKATTLAADTIVLDLEDALHEEDRLRSAALLDAALQRDFGYRQVLVRINSLDTEHWKADVDALNQALTNGGNCHGLVVPKVETTQSLEQLFAYLPAKDPLPVWIMIETPVAVLNAQALCSFGQSVCGILVGTADLGKALHLPANIATSVKLTAVVERQIPRLGLLTALGQIVLAARAAGLVAIDGVFMNFRDDEGLEVEAIQGLHLGFDGKTLIHPKQIDVANRVFTPAVAEIDEAREMIAAWQQASDAGQAVCAFKGRLVEELHVQQARARIAFHESIVSR